MTRNNNNDIQVLRAVAIAFVIIQHVPYNLIQKFSPRVELFYSYFYGIVGVDLFFVISGFVISRSLLGSLAKETKHDALRFFWIKRAYRILPAAWLWLIVILFLTVMFNSSGAFGSFRAAFEGAIAAVLNVANVRFSECYGFFECGPTVVYWSLSLEEQFYIFLPLIILLSKRFLPVVLVAFAVTQILFDPLRLPATFRVTGLALGVILGWYSSSKEYQVFFIGAADRVKARLIFFLLLLCLVVVLNPKLNVVNAELGYQIAAIVSAILVYMASMNSIGFFGGGALKLIVCWVGDRSYSLYLSHMPAFFASREIVHRLPPEVLMGVSQNWILVILSGVLMFVTADACFKYIEQPFQRKARERIGKNQQSLALQPDSSASARV